MADNAVKFSIEDQVAWITLNRPQVRNAINGEVLDGLMRATGEIAASSEIKAMVLSGEGEAFSAGADLKFLYEAMATDMKSAQEFGDRFCATVMALTEVPVPTIAMVNGLALAGGIELMLACDIAIAAEEAKIGDQHTNIDVIGVPSMWQLPRRLGLQRAMELVVTGKHLSGKEAEGCGLVLRAVPRERLGEELEALLGQLRHKSQPLLKLAKRVLRNTIDMSDERAALHYIRTESGRYRSGHG
ncbi:enoyl-CoA hydratase/isomerase family protein [Chloroflexota bacterium]